MSSALAAVPPTDAQLVEQARRGDERAFTTLYRRYARWCAGIVYRLTGNDAEIDDVLQEAFTDAAVSLDDLRDPEGFRGWLARIVVHRVHKRMSKRRRFRFLTRAVEIVAPRVSDPADRRRVEELYAALEQLPPDQRIPWVLHHVEGETLPEVAKMCDVSLATVKRRIADAETRLERRLHG